MACDIQTIDSNLSGLAFAEEECLKQLPAAVAAAATIVFSGTGTEDDTVTIGDIVYVLKGTPANPYEVDIGATASDTAANLRAAINKAAGEGTAYGTGTLAHPDVAASGAGANVIVTAKSTGEQGNFIAIAEDGTGASITGGVSNLTGGAGPVWYNMEPNSYSDFGGELTTVTRSPIDPTRQNKKGTVTDLDASGGFNVDFTKTNLLRLLQGLFFADARELPSTKPLNGPQILITDVDETNDEFELDNSSAGFAIGDIVLASGFANAANNGLKLVTDASASTVEVDAALTNETPSAAAKLETVGYQFALDDLDIAVSTGVVSLVSTLADFTDYVRLIPGAWIFLGSDVEGERFANNSGFARIKSVSENAIVFDDVTWSPAAESGNGKTIRIYHGVVIKNESEIDLIKRRSYQWERTLGMGVDGVQAEYLEGAVANEFTLNIPQGDKLNADLSFVACDNTFRSGSGGDVIKAGLRVPALGEDAYNTSSDVYRMKMAVRSNTSSPSPLFGYVTEGSISINNNVSPTKAIGVLGSFDTSVGNFVVGGSLTAYFTTTAAVQAVRNNADVSFNVISAAKNAGFIFDIPLLSLGGGRINVEKDQKITVPLEPNGAQNENGYTMLYEFFPYLPDVAMPE